mmetsp:Transcript_2156/g.6418  ORF Transcript_2156/g.6418 Transcript_2156/m.6418 type:complete len:203 (-) Transcript_2156:1297-1905(-)
MLERLQAWVEVLKQLQIHHVPTFRGLDQCTQELGEVGEHKEGGRRVLRRGDFREQVVQCGRVDHGGRGRGPSDVEVRRLRVEGLLPHCEQRFADEHHVPVVPEGHQRGRPGAPVDDGWDPMVAQRGHLRVQALRNHPQERPRQQQAKRQAVRGELKRRVGDLDHEEVLLPAVVHRIVLRIAEHAHHEKFKHQRVDVRRQDVG